MRLQRNTKILTAYDLRRDRPALNETAETLRAGGLAVFATETVYGLGANALDAEAVKGIYEAKGRPRDNPMIVHISRMKKLQLLVRSIPPGAQLLAERFWPGPLTMILPRTSAVPDIVSAGLDSVAVRMPSHPIARALINLADVPIAAPSANLSGSPSPTTAQHCIDDLDGRVDIILDSGACQVGLESTVISFAEKTPRLLRPGFVTLEQLREVLGEVEVDDAVFRALDPGERAASPGMLHRHYAPSASIWLVHGNLNDYRKLLREKRGNGVYALAFDEDRAKLNVPCVTYGAENDPQSQAERLFAALRELDEAGARRVYARAPDVAGVGLAVYNRLLRAANFEEIYLEPVPG